MPLFTVVLWLAITPYLSAGESSCQKNENFVLALHGGAGSWDAPTPREEKIAEKIRTILLAARVSLKAGAHAIDVAQQTVMAMEDSGMLNAGKGAVRNINGQVELDASIMDGRDLKAGAVAAVRQLKNPIHAARLVMQETNHVLLVGDGAKQFAVRHGATEVDDSYYEEAPLSDHEFGTVGAVVLDRCGHLAAATSTGGLSGKLAGRVGDSPLPGAGTFADNNSAAISGTGVGEYFIRLGVAREVAALMTYQNKTVAEAAHIMIEERLKNMGGSGGLIAVDAAGRIAMPFNTTGMLRGAIREWGEPFIAFRGKFGE